MLYFMHSGAKLAVGFKCGRVSIVYIFSLLESSVVVRITLNNGL